MANGLAVGDSRRFGSAGVDFIVDLRDIASRFAFAGRFVSASAYGNGHINDSYVVSTAGDGTTHRYLLQRINTHVFPDPAGLMDNVRRVTEHLRSKKADPDSVLTLVPTGTGEFCTMDAQDRPWRAYRFIENAVSYDNIQNVEQARLAAHKFGQFQRDLVDLPGPRLKETIECFHDTPERYRRFHAVLDEDPFRRAGACAAEIERALAYESVCGALVEAQRSGAVPERIIHNDTKLNNLLFDPENGQPKCVVDLDTVMPGLALYDFGDMVRTMTCPATEDAVDLSTATMRMKFFEALVEGYRDAATPLLTEAEVDLLPLSGLVITVETGLRFLTDHLAGDGYFKVHKPGQNLDRCRVQFAFAASLVEQMDAMHMVINRYFR